MENSSQSSFSLINYFQTIYHPPSVIIEKNISYTKWYLNFVKLDHLKIINDFPTIFEID